MVTNQEGLVWNVVLVEVETIGIAGQLVELIHHLVESAVAWAVELLDPVSFLLGQDIGEQQGLTHHGAIVVALEAQPVRHRVIAKAQLDGIRQIPEGTTAGRSIDHPDRIR